MLFSNRRFHCALALGPTLLLASACGGGSGGGGGNGSGSTQPGVGGSPNDGGTTPSGGLVIEQAQTDKAGELGSGLVGQAGKPVSFVVRNTATTEATLDPSSPLRITGDASTDFTVSTPLGATVLAPNATTPFAITFQPRSTGDRAASLTVVGDLPASPLVLHGVASCPTMAPVDLEAPGVRESCTRELVVVTGDRSSRIVSDDGGKTWRDHAIDMTNCLLNNDSTYNCGDGAGCNPIQLSDCKQVDGGGYDCRKPDPSDATKTICNGFDDSAFGAAFGLGLVVVAGDFGIFTSADAGKTWKKAAAPAPQQWGGGVHVGAPAFGNGMFIVASGQTTFRSHDGHAWERFDDTVGGGYYGFGGIAFGNGRFVAAHDGRKSSADGETWTDVGTDEAVMNVAFGNGQFVATGHHGVRSTSKDGLIWTQVAKDLCATPTDWMGDPDQCLGDLGLAAFGNNIFLACGTHFTSSPDGAAWTSLKSWTYRKVTFAGGTFWQDDGSRSIDGAEWAKDANAVEGTVSGGLVLKASAAL